MWPSKKLLCLLALTTLVTACTKPDKGEDESSASFVIKEVKGNLTTGNVDSRAVWKIPTEASLGFSVCKTAQLECRPAIRILQLKCSNLKKPSTCRAIPMVV